MISALQNIVRRAKAWHVPGPPRDSNPSRLHWPIRGTNLLRISAGGNQSKWFTRLRQCLAKSVGHLIFGNEALQF